MFFKLPNYVSVLTHLTEEKLVVRVVLSVVRDNLINDVALVHVPKSRSLIFSPSSCALKEQKAVYFFNRGAWCCLLAETNKCEHRVFDK